MFQSTFLIWNNRELSDSGSHDVKHLTSLLIFKRERKKKQLLDLNLDFFLAIKWKTNVIFPFPQQGKGKGSQKEKEKKKILTVFLIQGLGLHYIN